jgi:hypothetical protein
VLAMSVMMMMRWLRTRHNALDFGNSDNRDKLCEEKEQRKEDSECSDEDRDFNPRW